MSSRAGRDELVNVIDDSASPNSADQDLSGALASLAKYVGRPLTYAATGKVIGREFLFTHPGRPVERVRFFAAHKHFYEIVAQSPLGPDDPETNAFLASFRLLGS